MSPSPQSSPQSSPENPHQVVEINDSPVSYSKPAAASDAALNSAVAVAVQQPDTGANVSAKIDDISEKIESLLATQKEVIDKLAKVLEIARECLKCYICHEKLSGPIKVDSDCGQIVGCDTCLARQGGQTRAHARVFTLEYIVRLDERVGPSQRSTGQNRAPSRSKELELPFKFDPDGKKSPTGIERIAVKDGTPIRA